MLPNHNYFEILNLEPTFTQDLEAVNERLIELQQQVHPDQNPQATAQEKRLMMQYSVMINEAFGVIENPIERAIHLLELNGIIIDNETTKALPNDFLMEQMELREQLEEAGDDTKALKGLQYEAETKIRQCQKVLASCLDKVEPSKLMQARDTIFVYQFYQKLSDEIQSALNLEQDVES